MGLAKEYTILRAEIPPAVASLLPGQDEVVTIRVKLMGVEAGPADLSFPEAEIEQLLTSGSADGSWVLVRQGVEGPKTNGKSAVVMHQSLWLSDGTLLSSTRLGLRPAVVDLRHVPPFFREATVGRRNGSELVLLLPNEEGSLEGRVLQVSIVNIIR